MLDNQANRDAMKRRIRKLKQLETKIRFGACRFAGQKTAEPANQARSGLVWDEFFDLRETGKIKARYSLARLVAAGETELNQIIDEFYWSVYYRFYQENGILDRRLHDPAMLARLGLPADADSAAIKKRFRELAKQCHPDTGGDSASFIALIDQYRKLTEK